MTTVPGYIYTRCLVAEHGFLNILYSLIECAKHPEFRTNYETFLIRVGLKDLVAEIEKSINKLSSSQEKFDE